MLDLVVLRSSDEGIKRIRPFDVPRRPVTEMIFPRSKPVCLYVNVSVPESVCACVFVCLCV